MLLRTLLPCLMCFGLLATATAQIPNSGFEQWVDQGGYTEPAGWLTYNDLMTPQGYFATCDPGMPGAVGAYHAVITSRTTSEGSTIQGWMATSFPYTQRPADFTGQWQYGIQPMDAGEMWVALVGWNGSTGSPEMIAFGILEVTGNVNAWTPFTVPLTYISSATPDTALIQFAASKEFTAPVAGSYMKVDDLAFAGSVGLGEMAATPLFSLYPSPTTDVLHIVGGERITEVTVVDMSGRAVMRHGAQAERITLNVQELPAGRYFVHGRAMDGTRGIRSFVKQ